MLNNPVTGTKPHLRKKLQNHNTTKFFLKKIVHKSLLGHGPRGSDGADPNTDTAVTKEMKEGRKSMELQIFYGKI